MPRRELKHPRQVEDWLVELSEKVTAPAGMILIGSGALLWHAAQRGSPNRCRRTAWTWTRLPIPRR